MDCRRTRSNQRYPKKSPHLTTSDCLEFDCRWCSLLSNFHEQWSQGILPRWLQDFLPKKLGTLHRKKHLPKRSIPRSSWRCRGWHWSGARSTWTAAPRHLGGGEWHLADGAVGRGVVTGADGPVVDNDILIHFMRFMGLVVGGSTHPWNPCEMGSQGGTKSFATTW